MIILGIETSCDETAVAIVENKGESMRVRASKTASSAGLHAQTGGVIPEEAARKQIEVIVPLLEMILTEAKIKPSEIDGLAVTYGPGLIGSLLVGVETAKTLSVAWNKPIIPVNHLLAHIYAAWITDSADNKEQRAKDKPPSFPALALVVSGGHTDMVVLKNHQDIKWIGGTRDDAAGEVFDKTARLLGIDYPGGPNLAKIADIFREKNNVELQMFPRPMIDAPNFDFSFSGLKTAVLHEIRNIVGINVGLSDYEKIAKNKKVVAAAPRLAAEIQEAIADVLVTKTLRAAQIYNVKSVIVGGGVSANKRLAELFEERIAKKKLEVFLHVPQPKHSIDNAEMIATYATLNFNPRSWEEINANPELTITGY